MVGIIGKRPKVYTEQGLPEQSDTFKYFELAFEGSVYGYAALDVRFPPFCLLHLEITSWSHNICRELKWDWRFAKNIIRALGCSTVVLTKRGNMSKQGSYKKLIYKFGFSEPIEYTQSQQEI